MPPPYTPYIRKLPEMIGAVFMTSEQHLSRSTESLTGACFTTEKSWPWKIMTTGYLPGILEEVYPSPTYSLRHGKILPKKGRTLVLTVARSGSLKNVTVEELW